MTVDHLLKVQHERFGRLQQWLGRAPIVAGCRIARLHLDAQHPHPFRQHIEQRVVLVGPGENRPNAIADVNRILEIGSERFHRSEIRQMSEQTVQTPEQRMNTMNDRKAGQCAPGGNGVHMDRIAIAAESCKPLLIGVNKVSFCNHIQ